MNIGRPLTQGLFEDLVDPFGDIFRPAFCASCACFSWTCRRLSICSWLQHSISIRFCVAKRSASISSAGGVSTTAMDIVCSSLCSSRA
jgi:hypothetical protein